MNDNEIAVKISANAAGFRAGAQEAEAHTESLRSKLIELKGEHVQSARVARFYATEIADIVPGADAARESLQALVKVGLAEGAFGVALAGIGLVVAAFHEVSEAIDKSGEHFKKLEEDSKAYAKKITQHVDDVIAALNKESETEKLARTEGVDLLGEKIKLTKHLAAAEQVLADINANVDENGGVADVVGLVRAEKAAEGLRKELEIVQSDIDSLGGGRNRLGSTVSAKESAQNVRDFQKLALDKQLEDAAHYLAERKRRYDAADAESLKAVEKYYLEQDAFQQIAINNDIEDAAHFQRIQKQKYDATLQDTLAFFDAQDAAAAASAKKLDHELGQAAKELGDAMGRNLADVLKGTKSIDDALQDVLATLIKVAAQIALMQALSAGGPLGIIGGLGIAAVGSALGSLFGGGGSNVQNNHITVNGSGLSSRQMETAVVNALRSAQRRGRY